MVISPRPKSRSLTRSWRPSRSLSRTVQERADQPRGAVQLGQDCLDLVAGQHDRQSLRLAGPHHSFDAVERQFQHVFVKEQHRRQSLVLRGRGHVCADREMRQETVDVALCQFARVRADVKQNEAANPVEVGLFGTAAVVSGAQGFYHAVVEPRCRLTRE